MYEELEPSLLVESRGSVRIVKMNAPDRLNSVDEPMHRALQLVWDLVADDVNANAVVFTGAGRAFCAGGHVPNFMTYHRDPEARRRDTRRAERLSRAMIDCEVPVVAAVNGPAIGLGASLALHCDLVFMAESAFLADPHVSVGVVAGDGGAVMWPLLTSLLRAKQYLLLGDRISSAECERLGLANGVYPDIELLPSALAVAQRLAHQPRYAVRDTKRTLNMHVRQAAQLALSFGLVTERESFAGDDVANTVARFENGVDEH
jgi:enoyl-CoA hydratase